MTHDHVEVVKNINNVAVKTNNNEKDVTINVVASFFNLKNFSIDKNELQV